jgi:hypothetical protein
MKTLEARTMVDQRSCAFLDAAAFGTGTVNGRPAACLADPGHRPEVRTGYEHCRSATPVPALRPPCQVDGGPSQWVSSHRAPPPCEIAPNDAPMFVNGSDDVFVFNLREFREWCSGGCCCVRTRQGRATPGGAQALIRSRGQRVMVWTGGGRQIVRRPARVRQPIRGSGRPRSSVGCQSATWRRWG